MSKTITFHCYDVVHGLDANGNPTEERKCFDVTGELRADGTVLVHNDATEDDEWGSPEAFQPNGLAVCEGWDVEEPDDATRTIIDTIKALRDESEASWQGCVDTAGIAECGARHDQEREDEAEAAMSSAMCEWDEAIECLTHGDVDGARGHLNYAKQLADEWGDDSCERQAIELLDEDDDMVTLETMPDHLRGSHRAAGNWGRYPHNGAERSRVTRDYAEEVVAADEDGYDHIVE